MMNFAELYSVYYDDLCVYILLCKPHCFSLGNYLTSARSEINVNGIMSSFWDFVDLT